MFTQQALCDVVKDVSADKEKFRDLAILKANTIESTLQDKEYKTVLAYGFSLVAYGLAEKGYNVYVMNAIECTTKFSENLHHLDKTLSELVHDNHVFDMVLAVDQATTYVDTNQNQQELVNNLAKVTNQTLVTTLKDYKNLKSQEKLFDEPFYIKYNDGKEKIFLNHRKWDQQDRQAWEHYTYITDENQQTIVIGPVKRRTMYFKQLAKFLHDNNVQDFTVHKTPMYKSIFSRTFEYIITAEFNG